MIKSNLIRMITKLINLFFSTFTFTYILDTLIKAPFYNEVKYNISHKMI